MVTFFDEEHARSVGLINATKIAVFLCFIGVGCCRNENGRRLSGDSHGYHAGGNRLSDL